MRRLTLNASLPCSIVNVIEKILNEDWNDGDGRKEDPPTNSTQIGVRDEVKKKGRAVPEPVGDDPDDPCVDCYKCAFFDLETFSTKVSHADTSTCHLVHLCRGVFGRLLEEEDR